MHSPDIVGAWQDASENLLHLYLKYKRATEVAVLILLLILYFAFTGFQRYSYQTRIQELEQRRDGQSLDPYMAGVKDGLQFKKTQQGGMPCK